jgi:hypothetical protein
MFFKCKMQVVMKRCFFVSKIIGINWKWTAYLGEFSMKLTINNSEIVSAPMVLPLSSLKSVFIEIVKGYSIISVRQETGSESIKYLYYVI